MPYEFLKGHGTENDFVLLPDLDGTVHGELSADEMAERVRALSDRRAGIGGDGVLRVVRASRPDADWFMDYRNSDGSLSEMCGNGIRLFVRYLVDAGLADGSAPIPVDTRDGIKTLTVDGDLITVDMGTPKVLGDTTVGVELPELGGAPGRLATSTWATRTRWPSCRRWTSPARCSSRRSTTRRSTRRVSTSSSSYAAGTGTSRCASTSGAPVRPGRAARAPAPRWWPRPSPPTTGRPAGTWSIASTYPAEPSR